MLGRSGKKPQEMKRRLLFWGGKNSRNAEEAVCRVSNLDLYLSVFDFYRVRSDIVVIDCEAFSVRHIELPAVPGAGNNRALRPAIAEGRAVVGAFVVNGEKVFAYAKERQLFVASGDAAHIAVIDGVGLRDRD
jgi:hypothetical protein